MRHLTSANLQNVLQTVMYLITFEISIALKTDFYLNINFFMDYVYLYSLIQVCVPADYTNPTALKNHNEVRRCFSVLATSFPDRVVTFLLLKLDSSNERIRIGTLAVFKQLINSSGTSDRALQWYETFLQTITNFTKWFRHQNLMTFWELHIGSYSENISYIRWNFYSRHRAVLSLNWLQEKNML